MARPRGARTRTAEVVRRLREAYPDVRCALNHTNAFELLVATILSAQTTDERVNMVTPTLFAKYPTAADLAHADPAELESIIQSTGFFRSKAKNLIGMASALEERHGGEVPTELEDFVTLPGVGRKTGNVVRSVWFRLPGLPVDTHVTRLARRLRLTNETDPVKIELDLNGLVDPDDRGDLSLRLIEHGRKVCDARAPRCDVCVLSDICPSAFTFDGPKRTRRGTRAAGNVRAPRAARSPAPAPDPPR
jgi:endonuclease-3